MNDSLGYLLINRTGCFTRRVTLTEASQAIALSPDDILWAIENYGRCDAQAPTGADLVIIADKFEDGIR